MAVPMALWVGVGAVIGYLLLRVFAGYPPVPRALRRLWRTEAFFVAAAADAVFPPGGAVTPSGIEAGLPAYVDRYLDALPGRTRLLMHALFFLIEHATLVFPAPRPRGFRRFSSLSRPQREAALEGWSRSRLFPRRLAFTSLRAILTMGYFASPRVLRELELAPLAIEAPVVEADLLYPPVGKPPEAIAHGVEDLERPVDRSPLVPGSPIDPRYAEARE